MHVHKWEEKILAIIIKDIFELATNKQNEIVKTIIQPYFV